MSDYPESQAERTVAEGDLLFSILKHPSLGHYCGYVRFPRRPVKEAGYKGILTYVPVHGGITYAKVSADGSMVYGFDCAHAGDEDRPDVKDPEWILAEVRCMASGILAAARIEDEYLADESNTARAVVLDRFHADLAERGIKFDLQDNFGSMINLMCAKL